MGDLPEADYISDLPQSIIDNILTKLPIKDAVRTSIISSNWRYMWNSISQLLFDDRCVTQPCDRAVAEKRLVKFITRALFLHQGPIHKFQLCTSLLESSVDLEQWISFLSRNDIKDLVLKFEGMWFRLPSCLFSCEKLILLKLFRGELDPPPTFKGFKYLKGLKLSQVSMAQEAINCLISSCPLLEMLDLSNFDGLALSIHAPNLKYLRLDGAFMEICLETVPLLVAMDIVMHMTEEIIEHFGQRSRYNFFKIFGGVPLLEMLIGVGHFTEYLSIGEVPRRVLMTYSHLKTIELHQVSFQDTKEILVLLHIIKNSPSLKELHITVFTGTAVVMESPVLDFWGKECPSDCPLEQLEVVEMAEICCVPHEMEFIKYLLGNSPSLRMMSITPFMPATDKIQNTEDELGRYRRASPRAEIFFFKKEFKFRE